MARAVPLARLQVDHLVNNVRHARPARWPKHLRMAREILELHLSEALALDVLARSVAAACACAAAINRKSLHLGRTKIDEDAAGAFDRVAKCIRRAPAELRQHLDGAVAVIAWATPIDTEAVTDVIEAAVAAFSAHRDCEPAKTALAALTADEGFGGRRLPLRHDCSALSWQVRANIEAALSALASQGTPTAASVFAGMAAAARPRGAPHREIHPLIVGYVAEVADLWRSAGLRPGRAYNRSSKKKGATNHSSKFHRFVDLILTAIVEPWSRRHDDDLDAVRQQILSAIAQIPERDRGDVAATLKHCDTEWLVSDDHLKKALGGLFKKRVPILLNAEPLY
jgi:hypothetical protein